MAVNIEPKEKTDRGLEIPPDASTTAISPALVAELPQEMGAFQAYKVGLPDTKIQQYETDRTRPDNLPVWVKDRSRASRHSSCGSRCFWCWYCHADLDLR